MKAVFLDLGSLDCNDLDLSALERQCDSFTCFAETSAAQVSERIAGAELVIVNKVVLDKEVLASSASLKHICIAATGTNNVDLQAAAAQGISVSNCQAYGTDSVAQHVMTMMLALHTNLIAYNNAARNGQWARASQFCLLDYPIQELSGKTLGIVGYGNLGAGVARLAGAFGMEVLIAQRAGGDTVGGRIAIDELLPQVDVLSLHCPLTDLTRNLINAETIALMKPGAFIINAARGGIVNEADLADALRQGRLAGAATDVLIEEPPVNGNPLLAEDIPNLIITPHSAWGSVQARQRIVEQMAETIAGLRQGERIRIVN
ncbi:2-hydroxyacid dehydrogenase [Amphritea balenae]|uniref:2-hydroxyacid dehydrogenase n=1 Tax=Amphritea balenae TaxID=452629 RepID=A0A3P1STT8_9GAMM|nr:2-hydroxyacid dehydrogenase [Amphritea balenae]RRD00619.1 2-hydroxyacid dehydrogenase [Amphritea balenae]GGK69253.1 glycerate dehydrogenase [Amphritea balenae]